MTNNPQQELRDLQATKEFFVGIDSDGCVFDTMEIKQKECFCPNFIKYWELQTISKFAREAWEFVNLYSKNRGINRFIALIETVDLLEDRKEVKDRNAALPDLSALIEWVQKETKLGNPTLEKYAAKVNHLVIDQALNWSLAVNDTISEMVYGIGPFSFVKEALKIIHDKSDAIVVSQTPLEALTREWEENNLTKYVRLIASQEYGTKTEHLSLSAKEKYSDDKILMIGDAPGDRKAAETNGVLFFPVNPGHEDASWERLYNEGLNKFYSGTFKGHYQESLINEFESYLPELPPWK